MKHDLAKNLKQGKKQVNTASAQVDFATCFKIMIVFGLKLQTNI